MSRPVASLDDARRARTVRLRVLEVAGDHVARLSVTVHGQTLVLRGQADSVAVHDAVIALATTAGDGVPTVSDELQIRPPSTRSTSDQELEVAVVRLLDDLVPPGGATVHVEVRHGTVLLTGVVDCPATQTMLLQAIASLPEVGDVLTGMVLRTHPSAARVAALAPTGPAPRPT